MTVLISRAAEADLASIYAKLASDYGISSAEAFRVSAESASTQLGRRPEIGPHPAWATRHKKLRFWIITRTNNIIYYENLRDAVSKRVLDGRGDVHRTIEMGTEEPEDDPD